MGQNYSGVDNDYCEDDEKDEEEDEEDELDEEDSDEGFDDKEA